MGKIKIKFTEKELDFLEELLLREQELLLDIIEDCELNGSSFLDLNSLKKELKLINKTINKIVFF